MDATRCLWDTVQPDGTLVLVGTERYTDAHSLRALGMLSSLRTAGEQIVLARVICTFDDEAERAETIYESIAQRLKMLKLVPREDAQGRAIFGLMVVLRTKEYKLRRAIYYEACEVVHEGIDLVAGESFVRDVLTLRGTPRDVTLKMMELEKATLLT